MIRPIASGLVSLSICVCTATSFAAAPNPTAEAAIRDGKDQYNSGDYEAAIQSFTRAYAAQADSESLYRLGKAYAMADLPVQAVDAFERYLSSTHVSEDRRREVAVAIAGQRRRIGSLFVQVTPGNAIVKVDETLLARGASAMPLPVRQGSHVVTASLDGYSPQVQVIHVQASGSSVVSLVLSPVAPPTHDGLLTVRCSLPAVTVFLDEHPFVTTPVLEPLLIPEGTHQLRLHRVGYRSQVTSVRVARAKATAIDCRLPMTQPLESSGQLHLNFAENGAEVVIDGLPAGRSNVLPPGPHSVQVRHYGFEPWVRQLRVETGGNHQLDVMLRPTRAYLHDLEERARYRRGWAYILGATGVAIAGTAVGIGIWNHGRYSDWSQARADLQQAYQAPVASASADAELEQRRNDVNSQLRSIHSVDIVTAMLGVAGGMLLGSSALIVLTSEQTPHQHGQPMALQRAPLPTGLNLAW